MAFLREIKRRRIFQVAAGYAVVAWLLAQVSSVIEEPLSLPGWFDTFVIVMLAIGFPIVMFITWAFNLTPERPDRDRGESHSPNRGKAELAVQDRKLTEAHLNDDPARASHASFGEPGDVNTSRPVSDKPSIAVLPFQGMSGSVDQDYLADGVVESITAGLSCIRSFFVIARNSAFVFKNRAVNAVKIGKELGVAYLLEGSVQKHGERVRITAQLIETTNGAQIWAKHYDGRIDELFDLQDRITESVAGELQPSIRIAEIERSGRKRPQDQGAYDFTMRAMRHVWALERQECEKGLHLLESALALEPDYPLALSLAGWCHAQRGVYNWSNDVTASHSRARELAGRAAELSGDDSLILAVLGAVNTLVRDFGPARALLERAVALDPNAAWAWQRLGWLETYLDHSELALQHFARALRLSPLDPMKFNVYAGIGSAYEAAQDYDQAVAHYRRALEERPHAFWIYRNLPSALVGAGQMEEARDAYKKLMSNYPDLTVAKLRAALLYSDRTRERLLTNLKALGLPD